LLFYTIKYLFILFWGITNVLKSKGLLVRPQLD